MSLEFDLDLDLKRKKQIWSRSIFFLIFLINLNQNHILRKPNKHTYHIIKRRMIATSKEVRKEIYHHQSFSFSLKNDCLKRKFLFKARGSHSLKNVNILCLFNFLANSHFRFWNQISPKGIDYPAYRYLENYLKELLSWTL